MKLHIKKIILLFITLLFLYLVFKNLNFSLFIQTIRDFELKYIILLALSILISLSFRGLCFKLLISKTVKAPLSDLVPLCISGAALNIVLPARAGDIFRAIYTGKKYDISKVKIFGAVMLERIFDGLCIIGMLLIGIFIYNKNPLAQHLCSGAAIIFIGSLIFALFAIKFNKVNAFFSFLEKLCNKPENTKDNLIQKIIKTSNNLCNSFIEGFEILKYPKQLLIVLFVSGIIWSFECINYLIVIQGFNLDINWSVVLFIIGFIALACMIPSTSIFIGPYQLAVISAFAIYHIPKETALAISLIEQAIVVITTSIVTVMFLLKNNISFKDLKNKINSSVE